MKDQLSRREFLRLGSLGLAGSLLAPVFPPEKETPFEQPVMGRVTVAQVSVHSLPRDDARIVRQIFRDRIVHIYQEVDSEQGPIWNPLWYRIWGGYVHSGFIQKVEVRHQPVVERIPEEGWLAEVTVPYTETRTYSRFDGWQPLYRLYYQTNHWITDLVEGPDRGPWYQVYDELTRTYYFAPAIHFRLFDREELTPISPDVPFGEKRIEVNLGQQTLTAYEAGEPVLQTLISSGIRSNSTTNGIPTNTPTGTFNISVKMPSKHMGDGRLTDNLEDYELVGVPWTAFFDPRGYAIHGAYWHSNFGIQMSRGCINMKIDEAKWLFRWMAPASGPQEIDRRGFGTRLDIV